MDKTVHNTTVGQGVGYLSAQPETVDPSLMVLLRGLPLERRTRVVDVGANPNVADAPYLAMTQQGLCDVLGFEPHPGAFAELQKIKGPREHYLPFAVGDGSAKELKVYKSHGFTSIFEPAEAAIKLLALKPWSDIKARIAFDTVRLDDSADVDRFDLLKIDIQGGEGDVFTGAAAKLQTACMVIVELRYFALYKGEPMLSGIDTQLRRLGFQLHKIFAPVSRPLINSQINRLNIKRNPDQVIDGDAVYVRDLDRLKAFDDAQVLHMAMLAAAVVSSHSLVVLCLDELVARGLVAADLPAAYVDALPERYRRAPKEPGGRV